MSLDNIFAGLDRVDHYSILDCIKLAEDTLNYNDAKEYNIPEARFNSDFDEFMNGLDHTDSFDSNHIENTPQFLDSTNDKEFMNYLDKLDYPWHPSGRHSTFECHNLRRALGAPQLAPDPRQKPDDLCQG